MITTAWIQIIIETTPVLAEARSEALMDLGAVAVSLEDAKDTPLFEPLPNTEPLWEHTRVIGLFDNNNQEVNIEQIKQALQTHISEQEYASITVQTLADKDWVTITNQYEPMCFGKHFWIVPSTAVAENSLDFQNKDPKATYMILDPGLAFGTGTHPTTALCLTWLAENPPINKKVLDYGCGSGILGIAALKLGAAHVMAVDHDPQALYSTEQNAQKNDIVSGTSKSTPEEVVTTPILQAVLPEAIPSSLLVDLILANILAEPLQALAPQFAKWLPSSGTLILSGILTTQVATLTQCYKPWFTDFEATSQNEWARIKATRK